MNYSNVLAAAAVALSIGVDVAAAQPVGFERWTPLNSSYVEFNKTCEELQERYNYPDFFGSRTDPETIEDREFRLIDIEVRSNVSGHKQYDGVVVTNTGSFNRKSWLICDLPLSSVRGLAQSKSGVLLDVEKYSSNSKERYAVIFQLHEFQLDTIFIPSARLSDINMIAGNGEYDEFMRVVDIDHVGYLPNTTSCDNGEACGGIGEPLYSAVLIENSGGNHVLWNLEHGNGDGGPFGALVAGAYQLVDRELTLITIASNQEVWHSAMLSVAVDNDYHTRENLDQAGVHAVNHSSYGVVIDLEWEDQNPLNPGIFAYDWYVVTARKF